MLSYSICHSISYMVYPIWCILCGSGQHKQKLATSDDISRMPGGRVSISALAACYFIFEQGEAVRFNDVITQHTTSRARAANLANREQTLFDFLALSLSLSLAISLYFAAITLTKLQSDYLESCADCERAASCSLALSPFAPVQQCVCLISPPYPGCKW